MIKAIETHYAGCRFRSRLEARWAVFFDKLGIRWEYEPQGYFIDDKAYLPDFKLHLPDDLIVFAEVKPTETDEHEGEHIELCRGLAHGTGRPVVLLVGVPDYRLYHQFTPKLPANSFMCAYFHDYGPMLSTADAYWYAKAEFRTETGTHHFVDDERGLGKSFGKGLPAAVKAARSARFEHGEAA